MLIQRIKLKNILSFGPSSQELELRPLNVLIGPNGAGKSNLLEVIGLLKAAPHDVMAPIREGGGPNSWAWAGAPYGTRAEVEVALKPHFMPDGSPQLLYSLGFGPFIFGMPHIREVLVDDEQAREGEGKQPPYVDRTGGKVTLNYRDGNGKLTQREIPPTDFNHSQSVMSQLKDPLQYRELTSVGMELGMIRLYREWSFGRNTPPRLPQKADLPNYYLDEDGRNLGMVLNKLTGDPSAKTQFLVALRKLYHGLDQFHADIEAGSVQVSLIEGKMRIPATRLSDGTLRYLCLLAILCHPSPAPVVCLEEPELGLHPDILPGLADLLREASERCQLIVTTHSDTLVDALTDTPESIVICEKEEAQTQLKRLDKKDLAHWLEKYRLGELWTSGELGGNRW